MIHWNVELHVKTVDGVTDFDAQQDRETMGIEVETIFVNQQTTI